MSKLVWFIFLLSFATVFEESRQLNGILSPLDVWNKNPNMMEIMDITQQIHEAFIRRYSNPNKVPEWRELRLNELNNLNKLMNLCVLAWHEISVKEGHRRHCFSSPQLKEYENKTVLVSKGEYIIDSLICDCSWIKNTEDDENADSGEIGEQVDTSHPFSITPYSATGYFKLTLTCNHYRIMDYIKDVPLYSNISEEIYYYDKHFR